MNQRWLRILSISGVQFIDPATTWVDVTVRLGKEVIVHPGVILRGETQIGDQAIIGPYVVLENVEVGERVHLKVGTVVESSRIEAEATVGPYAHLRPQSVVGPRAKIGNFVELKKTRIGEATSIAHLSYLGDAEVGKNVNIGCGFITCNFDGRVIRGERKHKTVIEDHVFLGSDCQTVAPVRIGSGAYIASGSTITKDVESESFAIARSKQVNKPGYAHKLRQIKED
jgi:bifunctional UDP-N-acetylglucosamine pyrophosphorylase/glucosamine-1-phosphate N-acetyltransferase